MKIREGAYYRTRGGDVVGPMRPGPVNIPFCWETGLSSWDATGAFSEDGKEHDLDLISEVYVSDTPPADTPSFIHPMLRGPSGPFLMLPEAKTLRDEFAMALMERNAFIIGREEIEAEHLYRAADAMMEARKK